MTYKRQVCILGILAAFLALAYAGSLIWSPDRLNARSAAYRWADPQRLAEADRIAVRGEREFTLARKDGRWFIESGGAEYPAKESRIDGLLSLLSARSAYPVRGGAASHGRLGLTEGAASRITVWGGGESVPILDLLIGGKDASGREVYLRKSGQDEVRSGEDQFSALSGGDLKGWYDLRLFADAPGLDGVQRVTVTGPDAALVVARHQSGWTVNDIAQESLDGVKIEPYIRSILDAEGDDFTAVEPVFSQGRIRVEFGDGSIREITLGPERTAAVSGSPYCYVLTEWTLNRIVRDAAYFAKPE
ncbi:MAG: DUF4340 domain-containing protein [Treponema sp.]|jgi:hypothetical protein|nr:DUF4340 domain-containing protein [Treponema sp.]